MYYLVERSDKNTRYFQRIANSHRRYNCIDKLQVEDDITEDKYHIKEVILDYQDLYPANEEWRPTAAFGDLNCLDNDVVEAVKCPFEEDGVPNAIISCAPYKNAGSDGFAMAFYQKCWATIK